MRDVFRPLIPLSALLALLIYPIILLDGDAAGG